MPVRVRPSASMTPSACDGRHATLRRSKTRFDSWRGHWDPRECGGGTAVFEAAGPGPTPGRGMAEDRPRGVRDAHDPAKVEGQVRLLAGTSTRMTLEPDGQAGRPIVGHRSHQPVG